MQGEGVPWADRDPHGAGREPELRRARGPAQQVQPERRRHPAGTPVDRVHRIGEAEARAAFDPEQLADLSPDTLRQAQRRWMPADREHQGHGNDACRHDQGPARLFGHAQVREQQDEGGEGVDRLGQGLDSHVDDGGRRRRAGAPAAEHRQGPGADAFADGGNEAYQVGESVADPTGNQAGENRHPLRHPPPGKRAEHHGDRLQQANLRQPPPADRRQGARRRLQARVHHQHAAEGEARQENQGGREPADHAAAFPTKSRKRPSRTSRQAAITSGSVSA